MNDYSDVLRVLGRRFDWDANAWHQLGLTAVEGGTNVWSFLFTYYSALVHSFPGNSFREEFFSNADCTDPLTAVKELIDAFGRLNYVWSNTDNVVVKFLFAVKFALGETDDATSTYAFA